MTCPKAGKVSHRSKRAALAALRSLEASGKGDAAMSCYYCRDCRAWHTGHDRHLAHDRITQLLATHQQSLAGARHGGGERIPPDRQTGGIDAHRGTTMTKRSAQKAAFVFTKEETGPGESATVQLAVPIPRDVSRWFRH